MKPHSSPAQAETRVWWLWYSLQECPSCVVLYVHFCTPEAGQSETPPQPSHQCLPSKRMTRIPATHHCWTVDHPHVPSHLPSGQSHAFCPAAVGAILLSFLKWQVTSSHSSALDHNFLLSPQKSYVFSSWRPPRFFLSCKNSPSLLINWVGEGAHP